MEFNPHRADMITVLFYFFTVTLLLTVHPTTQAVPVSTEVAVLPGLPDTLFYSEAVPDTVLADTLPVAEKPALHFGLLLPLYLEENFMEDTSGAEPEIDPRSLAALHFYEGALIARDQLAREGIVLDIGVTDISQAHNAKQVMLLNYHELRKNDLLIAWFPPGECESALIEAGRLGIRLALAQYGSSYMIRDKPDAVLMSSPPFVQCRLMADFLVRSHPEADYYIVSRAENREQELAGIFKSVFDTALADSSVVLIDDLEAVFPNLPALVDTNHVSNLIFPSSDESFVSSVLNRLDTLNLRMMVTGLPTWEDFQTLRLGKFQHLAVRIFSSTWFDAETQFTGFRKDFIETYKTDALFPAYQAFEFCTRTARMLSRDPRSFPSEMPGAFSGSGLMRFMKVDGGGYENVRIQVLEYDDYTLRPVE